MKKQLISNRVLTTELRFAMEQIDKMNFGYAKEMIQRILDRVNEYELKRPRI